MFNIKKIQLFLTLKQTIQKVGGGWIDSFTRGPFRSKTPVSSNYKNVHKECT